MTLLLTVLLGATAVLGIQAPAAQEGVEEAVPASPSAEAYLQFMLGRRFEEAGAIERAIAAFRKAAELDPSGAEIRAQLAGLYARQDRAREALEWAHAALEITPDNREANRILGLLYAAMSNRPATAQAIGLTGGPRELTALAIEHLQRADATQIVDPTLHYTLGRILLRERAYRDAIEVLRRLRDEQPGASEAALLLADALQGAGQTDEARETLEDAVTREPSFARARARLAELYEQQGRWTDAAEQYDLATEHSPRGDEMVRRRTAALLRAGQPEAARETIQRLAAAGDASDLHLLFQAERDLGDLDAAESTARRIIAAEPDGVRGVHALAQILDQRRDFVGEIALLEPAIARGRQGRLSSRQLGVLLTQLGFAHQKLGQHDQAIAAFEQLRAVAPSDPSGAAYLVQAYLADGRTEEAVELAEGARQRFQDDPAILFQLAAVLEQSGQDAEAERHFRDLLGLDPLNHQALNYLGYMLAEQDRSLEEAVALITRALERDPQNPFYLDSLGWAHFKLGQLDLAEQYLRLAARALTTSSVVQEHLGDVLFHLDRIDEAIAAWQLALEGDGQSVEPAAIAAKIRKARESGQRP